MQHHLTARPTLGQCQSRHAFCSRPRPAALRLLAPCRAEQPKEGGADGDSNLEVAFQQELERRKSTAGASQTSGGPGSSGSTVPPPSFRRAPDTPEQLERSRALNSEGLEGLIPRATELIKLGAAFTLAYGPFIAGVGLAFWAVYAVFGDAFIHGGTVASGPPSYVDPELLLQEGPPMTPFIMIE